MRTMVDLAGLAPFGLLQVDERRRIAGANPEAQVMLGNSERVMLRKPLSEVIFHDSPLFELIDRAVKLKGDVSAQRVMVSGPNFSKPITVDVKVRSIGDGGVVLALMSSSGHDVIDNPGNVAAFGRILGHEVKNPLAGISGAAQLLLRSSKDDQTPMLNIILSETKRIERLISRLSAFELFSSPRMDKFNIHALLDQVIAAEEVAQSGRVNIKRLFDPSLPELTGDQDHLHEALQNIVRNASEAVLTTTEPSNITIHTAFETGFAIARISPSGRLGRAIRITVEDNGPGIPREKKEKMFDLFTSTKSGGRGLGLNVVSEVIKAHNGRIKIDSQPGKTLFSVYLPILRERNA